MTHKEGGVLHLKKLMKNCVCLMLTLWEALNIK